jgi:MFS family permease
MGSVLGAGLSGPLLTKLGRYKGIMLFGAIVSIVSFILMTTLKVDTPYWLVVVYMFVVGLGFGPSQSIFALASQNAVAPPKIGQATSAIQFSRQIGSVMAAAVLGVIFNSTLTEALPRHGIDASRMPGGNSSSLGDGTKEIHDGIVAGFDKIIARLDTLFTLRGPEARAALDSLLAEPGLPAEMKTRLAAGTPAMQIDAGFASIYEALDKGDAAGLAKLLDPKAVDAAGNPGPGASMPAFVGTMLVRLAAAPPAQRQAQLPAVKAQMEAEKASLEDSVSLAAGAKVHETLEKLKIEVADSTVAGMKASFSDAVVRVWFYGVFISLGLFLASLMIPGLPLRGRGETGGGGKPGVEAVATAAP